MVLPPPISAPDGALARVAVVGAGFVGRGLVHRLSRRSGVAPPLLINRDVDRAWAAYLAAGVDATEIVVSTDPAELTAAVADARPAIAGDGGLLPAIDGIDVVIEATGALEYGIGVMVSALHGGRHVVSMNAEADALLGHRLAATAEQSGACYSIGDGDQPGVLLRMMDEARALGLEPTVALNCKRNLDVHQSPEDSRPYAERDGTSVAMTTAFGDGTKMHIENVVTANLSGLRPVPLGTPGVRTSVASVATDVPAAGIDDGAVHFTLGGDFGGGVVVLVRSVDPEYDAPYLRYGKLGDGPLYPLFRPYHLIHMEVPTTVDQVMALGRPLGSRTPEPVAMCAAVAKRPLGAGERLDGIGGATCYGLAATADEGAPLLPVGLSQHAVVRRPVPIDQPLHLDDVELDSEARLVQLHAGTGPITV